MMRPVASTMLAVAIVAASSGCASVPLATMWKMRDITVDTFFAKDPRQLRVALRTTDRLKGPPGNPKFVIRADAPSKSFCYAFTLTPVDPTAAGEPPLDKLPTQRRWYVFALARQGLDAFDRARREVASLKGQEVAMALNVEQSLDFPDDTGSVPFGIDIAFDRKDGYFPLLKETSMVVQRGEPTATKKTESAPAAACASSD